MPNTPNTPNTNTNTPKNAPGKSGQGNQGKDNNQKVRQGGNFDDPDTRKQSRPNDDEDVPSRQGQGGRTNTND